MNILFRGAESQKVPSPDFYRFTEADEDAHVDAVLAQTEVALQEVGLENIAALVLEPVGGASTGTCPAKRTLRGSSRVHWWRAGNCGVAREPQRLNP